MGLDYKYRKRKFLLGLATVLYNLQKSLLLDSQKLVPNFLTRNAAELLPWLSDGFSFLLFDGEIAGPGAGRLRDRFIISD